MSFDLVENKKVPYYAVNGLGNDKDVQAIFSTRIGGISDVPFNSMNLSFSSGDVEKKIVENRKIFFDGIGWDIHNAVYQKQTHSDNIEIVDVKCKGRGIFSSDDCIYDNDALITTSKNVILCGSFADCVPLFLYDFEKKVIALVHSGWKGTLQGIGGKTVKTLIDIFACNPKNIKAAIGPSIGPCCFCIGEDVFLQFKAKYGNKAEEFLSVDSTGSRMDLWSLNEFILTESGIKKENIITSNLCTSCNHGLFFSHRRDNGLSGRMNGMIMLK